MTIAIAGLGLIGGSFAKAIKLRTAHRVIGYDRSAETVRQALAENAVDQDGEGGFGGADFILVALYPGDTMSFLETRRDSFRPGAVIVDLCGVKRGVCEAAERLFSGRDITFIGGHPMAGRELSGFANSIPTLFDGASMILTPGDGTPEDRLAQAEDFFLSLGFGRITRTTPAHHDEMIAFTSQLAHIVSSAYVQCPLAEEFSGFSAGSFGDMTRVAKLNEDMWTELFMENADCLTGQLDTLIANLSGFRERLAVRDREGLRSALRRGRVMKEKLNGERV